MIKLETPFYIVYEDKLRRNLELITSVAKSADVEIIMAFKANALWKTFSIFREYGVKSTASSLNEMQLGVEKLGSRTHTYCPAYTDVTIDKYIAGSSHITFNSIQQFERFKSKIDAHNLANPTRMVSCGLRINPEYSVIDTDIYNPCAAGSRFGVIADNIDMLPNGIDGFHFHALCESNSYDLEQVLTAVESKFGKFLPQLKWINMGGGHLMTKAGYDTAHLIKLLKAFKAKYPNL
ncbi:MAG: carboxynorspermidine decarboxylase, partial [Bacteroidales bacterium]